jgi:threonine/homoserine/homoserine lactone efflux protein
MDDAAGLTTQQAIILLAILFVVVDAVVIGIIVLARVRRRGSRPSEPPHQGTGTDQPPGDRQVMD